MNVPHMAGRHHYRRIPASPDTAGPATCQEIIMPIPQVNDRIKEAPVTVLRAVFAGIGQLLLTADKVRARAAEQVWPPDRAAAGREASQKQDWRSPGKVSSGAARRAPVAGDDFAPRTRPGSPGGIAQAGPVTQAAEPTATEPPASPPPGPGPGDEAAPPLPGYDELTLPSLRARLRVLDVAAVQDMLAYERAHARREPVITMLERRLAKIAAG
jgi:hypothetical protein